jgi:hypothetical protein
MQYALLIYETPDSFASRERGPEDPYQGAWRAYYRAMVSAGVYVGGDALCGPEAGTTVRHQAEKCQVQDGPYANSKEQLAGLVILELRSLDEALDWAARCPAASAGAVEVRPVATEVKQRITGEHA